MNTNHGYLDLLILGNSAVKPFPHLGRTTHIKPRLDEDVADAVLPREDGAHAEVEVRIPVL